MTDEEKFNTNLLLIKPLLNRRLLANKSFCFNLKHTLSLNQAPDTDENKITYLIKAYFISGHCCVTGYDRKTLLTVLKITAIKKICAYVAAYKKDKDSSKVKTLLSIEYLELNSNFIPHNQILTIPLNNELLLYKLACDDLLDDYLYLVKRFAFNKTY